MKKINKFVIVSPRQNNGGSIVLHNLCKILSDMGYNACIFSPYCFRDEGYIKCVIKTLEYNIKDFIKYTLAHLFPNRFKNNKKFETYLNYTVRGYKRKLLPFVGKNTIVVYPEVIHGNMLHAKNVVRWFLYYNPFKNDETAYDDNDMFICYRRIFNDENLNPHGLEVCTPYFDSEFYCQTNFGERHGKCYIVRKGKNRPDLPKEFDGPVIDDLLEKEKVEVLNKCEYCIIYDTQSLYSSIASCCGCISVVVPEEGKTAKDYVSDEHYGIAYGFSDEQIKYSIETRELRVKSLKTINERSRTSAEKFIEYCREYFINRGNNGK